MKWFWFPLAVVVTSLALVAALVALVAFPARAALASTLSGSPPWSSWHGGWGTSGAGFTLPPELQGLASIPADQRFSHFTSAQVNLKDKDGHPLTINVTSGTVTSVSATSLTLTANDGTTKTFSVDSSTIIHGRPTSSGTPTPTNSLQKDTEVVVITLNNRRNATAVIDGGPVGAGWFGPGGPWRDTGAVH